MALKTAYLIALLALGFFMLFLGWPWWMGIGLILVVMAAAVNDEVSEPKEVPEWAQAQPQQQAAAAQAKQSPRAALSKIAKAAEEGGGVEDMKWSPSTFADGLLGISPMSGEFGGSVGARSGTFTQDLGPLRFKDDIRFRLYSMPETGFGDICADPYTGKQIHALDFRTRKDFFPGLHTAAVKTINSPDQMLDPGLGNPWKKDKNKK